MGQKAIAEDFTGRFREIVSDPLNLAIRRDPRAGFVEGNDVYLHNGLKVPISGPYAYYDEFSSILCINRGVHEPLEEFVFQEVLNHLQTSPLMVELGAYWGHYSMWLKKTYPNAKVHLVEPEPQNLNVGKHNFELNGFTGEFIQAFVGNDQFEVDKYLAERSIQKIDILHSDIQGYEVEMLEGCSNSLTNKKIDYLFISTHSQQLHLDVVERLEGFGYTVEVSSDFDCGTTSFDGFIFASSSSIEPIFKEFMPMSRVQIEEAEPGFVLDYVSTVLQATKTR
ncbi:FkbM family methyltransferase [Leptolyngbya sp. FACHB-261]|uniref:FkbM family methyltransferase n=1 Tax=Leptolyngbya sp. FACHB-261 TaxID=2692806 RepID=UPI001681DF6B|nr:FkbM family methyltransferase [Leptolyngbya sp. FACHB-261]MBD2102510.1 FkbM family methyltransferase [Leptolyngbya sp. FACHB-261]